MNNLSFNIRFHDRDISAAELDRYQYERALHVLHELKYLGAEIIHGGKALSHIDINWLDPETAQAVLLDTKAALGEQGTLALLKDVLADSDRRWRTWAAEPIEAQGVWISQCDLAVEGVGVEAMAKLFSMEDLRTGLAIMPEHYYFAGAVASGKQYILETFGLFGEPTYTVGTVLPELPPYLAACRDESYPQQLVGDISLHSDGSRIHVGAYHQIKPAAGGFAIRSVFYCPKNAPKAVADGHVIHFAIELREGIKRGFAMLNNQS